MTESTSTDIRLNSSKHPHAPLKTINRRNQDIKNESLPV
jgi:hypothetical protein